MFQALVGLGFVGAVYGLVLPFLIIQIFSLLFIPSLLTPGARPSMVGKAAYCYILQTLGIVLMSVGGLPAFYGVLEKISVGREQFSTEMYIALLIVFAAGGLTFLWHEHLAMTVDEASRRVCASVFWFSFKLIGFLLALFSAVSFLVTMLLVPASLQATSWIMPALFFFYGLLLLWCTRSPVSSPQSFHSSPMNGGMHGSMMKKVLPEKKHKKKK